MLDLNSTQKAYCFRKNTHRITFTASQCMSPFLIPLTLPHIRSLVTGMSSQRPRFNVWEGHLGVLWWTNCIGAVSLLAFRFFPGQLWPPPMLHTHFHHLTLTGPQHTHTHTMMAMERSTRHTANNCFAHGNR